ncbi:MAG TPA: argininosuccinate lyase, partial [Methanosarcinales archaeon]|nr:argininosuccinate lyase [Methanosarcinales archaeon]
ENLLRQATAGFAMATELADTLVRSCGISFRTAHQIVGTLAREGSQPSLVAIDEVGLSLAGKRMSDLGLDEDAIADALDPVASIRTRGSGGPAPDDVMRVTQVFEDKLQEDVALLDLRCERVEEAMEMLRYSLQKVG